MRDHVEDANRARSYWIERAETTRGALAVLPSGRHARYHTWTQRLLERWVVSRLDRTRYRRVVDLGCGRGEWAALLAGRADEVYACDIAPAFVAETRERLIASGHPAWRVECADIRSCRLPRAIDLAYVGGVLTYLSDLSALHTLQRVRHALVAGGSVIVRDYCTFNLGLRSVNHGSGYSVHREPAEIIELAAAAGLRCVEARSSPSIYAEVMGNRVTRWPLRFAWRLATAHWLRASHTFVLRA